MGQYTIAKDWRGNPVAWQTSLVLEVGQAGGLRISIDAPYHGDRAPPEPSGRLWGLWHYEVVEVFVAGPYDSYVELEFGPHGHHLALRFAGERNLIDDDVQLDRIEVKRGESRWGCEVSLAQGALPLGPWRFNAYSISGDSSRQYCALFSQQEAEPDFHRLRYFRPLV